MQRRRASVLVLLAAATAINSGCNGSSNNSTGNDQPTRPVLKPTKWRDPGPPTFKVKLETSQGEIVIAVYRDWAPHGVDRFKELVESGYYDGCRFFRATEKYVQFGINGDPAVSAQWRDKSIPDDPVVASNIYGYVTFAADKPKSRATEVFFNLRNNAILDQSNYSYAPIGRVMEGMEIVERLYSGYGEIAPNGPGPRQQLIYERGNKYLEENFPKLDFIKKATVLAAEAGEADGK